MLLLWNFHWGNAHLPMKLSVSLKVRLTDLKQACHSNTPGSDITTIAAIGSIERYQFSAAILFDFDQAKLKPEAKVLLSQWLKTFTGTSGTLQINGHTDQLGSQAYNMPLSLRRAQSVAQFLQGKTGNHLTIEVHGSGESEPLVISNNVHDSAKNRRVEILYFPEGI